MSKPLDCVVVGGGPAGLTAAIYLARFHLSVLVIDGGQSRAAMIPTTHNHAGFPDGIAGPQLLARMRDHARRYGARVETADVLSVRPAEGRLLVSATAGIEVEARTVLLATGVVNRRLKMLEHLHDEALSRGLLRYCPVCDGYEVTDRPVAVIGTGERGFGEAEFLRSYTAQIALISPDGTHDLDARQRERLAEAGIDLLDGPSLGFALQPDKIEIVLPTGTHVFTSLYLALGTEVSSKLAIALGAQMTDDGCPVVDRHQRTSVTGLYAAGDLVVGLDQISHAMGQAGVAATAIRNDLSARKPLRR